MQCRLLILVLCAAATTVGCTPQHPVSIISPAPTPSAAAAPLTQPAEPPEASFTLDQIKPVPSLPAAAARPSQPPPLEAVECFAKARLALLDNQRFTAINFLERAASLDPASLTLQTTLSRAYLGGATYDDKSIAALERAVALEPDHLDLQTDLGREYLAKGDPARGIEHLRLALQTRDYRVDDAGAAVAEFFLANALQQQGYDAASLELYRRLMARLRSPTMAIRGSPELSVLVNHADALEIQVGELYQKHRQYQPALDVLEPAAAREPNNFELQSRVVTLLSSIGRHDEAIARATDAVTRFHASAESIGLLSEACRAGGRESEAASALARLHRQRPADRPLLFALADLLASEHRVSEAEALLSSSAQADPGSIEILRRRVELRRSEGDFAGAARILAEALAARPDDSGEIAPLLEQIIRPTAAGRLRLATLLSLHVPPAADAAKLFLASRVAGAWHREAEARALLEKAVTLRPVFAPAFRELVERIWEASDADPAAKAKDCTVLAAEALQADPALAAEVRGLAALRQSNNAQAAADLEEAVRRGARGGDLLVERAESLRLTGDEGGYESLLWRLVSDRPDFSVPYLELYGYYTGRASDAQAQRVLAAWLGADPQSVPARRTEAIDCFRGGRTAAAEAILLRLTAEHPDDPDVLATLAALYVQTKRVDELIEKLQERRKSEPGNYALATTLVDLYAEEQKYAEAGHVLDGARLAAAGDPDLLYLLSGLYVKIEQKPKAEEVLRQVLQLDPMHPGANNDLGYFFSEEGRDLAEAESLIRRAVEAEPHNTSFLDSMGWVLYKRRRFDEARVFLDKAIGSAAAGADPVVLDHRGDVLYRLGNLPAAQSDWERATDRLASPAGAARDDLKDLRDSLQQKMKQVKAGQPVKVAPVAEGAERRTPSAEKAQAAN